MSISEQELQAKQAELEKKIEEAQAKLAKTREEIEAYRTEKQAELDELQLKVAEIQGLQQEEVEEAPEEEPKKKEKVLKPEFDKVLEIAMSLQEEDWKINNKYSEETKTGTIKFNKGKIQFLILQATSSDYRITFLCTQANWSKYLTVSKAINVPKNAKGDKWLKLVNKSSVDGSLVRNVLKESVKGAAEEIERIAREKEEAKAAKKAAKKAEREKAKAEAQGQEAPASEAAE